MTTRSAPKKRDGRDCQYEGNGRERTYGCPALPIWRPHFEETELHGHVAVALAKDLGPARPARKAEACGFVQPERVMPAAIERERCCDGGACGHRPCETAVVVLMRTAFAFGD